MRIVLRAEQVGALDALKTTGIDEVMRKYYAGDLPECLLEIDGVTLLRALSSGYHTAENKWKEEYRSICRSISKGWGDMSGWNSKRILLEIAEDFGLDIIPQDEEETK